MPGSWSDRTIHNINTRDYVLYYFIFYHKNSRECMFVQSLLGPVEFHGTFFSTVRVIRESRRPCIIKKNYMIPTTVCISSTRASFLCLPPFTQNTRQINKYLLLSYLPPPSIRLFTSHRSELRCHIDIFIFDEGLTGPVPLCHGFSRPERDRLLG